MDTVTDNGYLLFMFWRGIAIVLASQLFTNVQLLRKVLL